MSSLQWNKKTEDKMTIHQLKDILAKSPFVIFKYVRIGDEFRFGILEENHVDLQSNNKATGAGFLSTCPRGIRLHGYSSTLNMGVGPGDEEFLSKLLNLPINLP